MKKRCRPLCIWVFIGILAMCLSGCASLKPWERGIILKPSMQGGKDPAEGSFETHVHQTREAMIGATGEGGGASCGCN